MNKSRILLLGATLILFSIAIILVIGVETTSAPEIQACTKEARMCPDGSAVGRTGPNCEFAACPTPAVSEKGIGSMQQIGEVLVTPIRVVADSRCPVDVTCIWAGTVAVETKLERNGTSTIIELTLNAPYSFENSFVTLTSVSPETRSTDPIKPEEYQFEFTVDPLPVSE